MWDKPFNQEMLVDGIDIAVSCPEEDLEREFAAILTAFGIKFLNGQFPLNVKNTWGRYKENFCYYVKGGVVWRGPKSSTEERTWSCCRKCTFYGEEQEDISDESFAAIIGR